VKRLALLAGLLAVACQPDTGPQAGATPRVVVSVPPQAWFVEQHTHARPAHYEPGFRELEALADASLYVRVGHPRFPLEGAWIDALLAERPTLAVVNTSAGLAPEDDDPHTWLSPALAREMARRIATGLSRVLPPDVVDDNLTAVLGEIDRVDAELRERLGPRRGGSFLVFHPAWGHLAREYELVQIAMESHGVSPDPATLAKRIREARAAGVSVVFAQPQFDPSSAELVAGEIGARVEMLDPLARDWPGNLRRVGAARCCGWCWACCDPTRARSVSSASRPVELTALSATCPSAPASTLPSRSASSTWY
jgi:zinc transport system substrate-binding protein